MLNKMATVVVLGLLAVSAFAAEDDLSRGFTNPPQSAKPQTWWHWMNGNVTKEGITADLEAMKRVGVGGAQIFNVDCGIPAGPVKYMSPEWRALIAHAAQEADRLGLELCIHNGAGWSNSGGPWITPEHAMQSLVFSEQSVKGPAKFSDVLPQPEKRLDYYRDIAVLAFPTPAGESVKMKDAAPKITSSAEKLDAERFLAGKSPIVMSLPGRGKPQFIQFEFEKPYTARAIQLAGGSDMASCSGVLQTSDDGKTFQTIAKISVPGRGNKHAASSFGPTTSRCWRLQFTTAGKNSKQLSIATAELQQRLMVDGFNAKAGYAVKENIPFGSYAPAGKEFLVDRKEVVDLTGKLQADGRLNWDVPEGDWTILRIGHTPTGQNNHPAPIEGTGPECDKFSKEAMEAHWAGQMKAVLDAVGPLAGKSLNNCLIDSYEVGCQQWTPKFREEFKARRGYDPLMYLPIMSGRVLGTPELSERFLWDYRRTIADLFAENYYGHFATLCHKYGLKASVEPYTGPFEGLQSGGPVDIPMGEFWAGSNGHPSVKLASSVGHIYGRKVVGAESFTAAPANGKWQNDPYSLKRLGDLMYTLGINRYIFHRYAQQPWLDKFPGMTMGQWGFHFDRTNTWFEQGRAWLQYHARSQYLLQSGRFVADAACFTGENAPMGFRAPNPPLPKGCDFDLVNAEVILHRMAVKDGRLVLPDGMSYRVLILPPDDTMTPALLTKVRSFVAAGAVVVGPRPVRSPSLGDYPACDEQIKSIADELYGNCDGKTVTEHAFGKGKIYWGRPLADVFAALALKPDFEFAGDDDTKLAYIHRAAPEAEIYFVCNQQVTAEETDCTFRVAGRVPELWNAETGKMELAPVWAAKDGRTSVHLNFSPAGSVFVVFREKASAGDHVVSVTPLGAASAVAPRSNLEIRQASYEAVDGSGSKDVTDILRKRARSGKLTLTVGNGPFGDPAYMHDKQLRIEYVLGGKATKAVIPEHQTVSLAGSNAPAALPAYELAVGRDAAVRLIAREAGAYQLKTASGKTIRVEASAVAKPQEVAGPWEVSFPPKRGAPERITLDKLISWTDHADPGVKYFSGTARYEKQIDLSADMLQGGNRLFLDLGVLKNLAEVSLNGQDLGILWKPPFVVDITAAAKPGANRLEVRITNLWCNRLIGDEQLPDDCQWNGLALAKWPDWLVNNQPRPSASRICFTTWHHFSKDSPLYESGLIGPVILRPAQVVSVSLP